MTAVLLDVNVLIALMWPAHEGHQRAQAWFAQNAGQGWRRARSRKRRL